MAEDEHLPPAEQDPIAQRIAREKAEFLLLLEKMPIIRAACAKMGIGHSTYYRWRKDDPVFATAADAAQLEGESMVSDMAVSKLIESIKEGNIGSVRYWLNARDPRFRSQHTSSANTVKSESSQPISVSWQNDEEVA